jgi:hypothetical protein
MQCVIRCRKPNVQIGDALLKSKLREFTGFGEDCFVLPSQFRDLFARWEVGEGEFHYREPFVSEEWHNNLRNIASKSCPEKRW